MSQAQFANLDAAILSYAKHGDFREVYMIALLAYGLALHAGLTASAGLIDLANRAGGYI